MFRVIDHSAIFLLIAGTYTPFTLGVLRGVWGWILFGLVWALAVFGVILKSWRGIRDARLSATLHIGMGWLALIAVRPLWLLVPVAGWLWLIAGGVAYTAGVAFYAAERLPYGHLVWHVFVLVGTTCHFYAVLWYCGLGLSRIRLDYGRLTCSARAPLTRSSNSSNVTESPTRRLLNDLPSPMSAR